MTDDRVQVALRTHAAPDEDAELLWLAAELDAAFSPPHLTPLQRRTIHARAQAMVDARMRSLWRRLPLRHAPALAGAGAAVAAAAITVGVALARGRRHHRSLPALING